MKALAVPAAYLEALAETATVDDNTEQVFIIYSVAGTPAEDIASAEAAIQSFRLDRSTGPIRVQPRLFRLPEAADPAAALSAELKELMDSCVGAIVFVDDLRRNIAYELGYFHGRGRAVLLVTRRAVDEFWKDISDLAGAAVAHLDRVELREAISDYLTRLYQEDLPRTNPVPLLALPCPDDNLLGRIPHQVPVFNGPYGPCIRVDRYDPPVELGVRRNLHPGARVRILLRAPDEESDYSIYSEVRYTNYARRRRRIWIGVTSLRRDMWLTQFERQFPGRSPTADWQLLSLELSELLDRGLLLGASGPDHLHRIWVRAGARNRVRIASIEIGYIGVSGIDA